MHSRFCWSGQRIRGRSADGTCRRGIGIEQIAVTGHCSVTFLCEPFAESIGYNQKAAQSVSLPDTVTINVKGTQETDGLIYITARGTITNLTVTRLKVN